MHIEIYKLIIWGLVTFTTGVLSGISGGGGGFIATPLLIFFGLSPAQAVSTGKLGGLAVTLGSLRSLQTVRTTSWKNIFRFMLLALVIGTLTPFIIKSLDAEIYRRALGILILGLVPLFIWKQVGLKVHKPSAGRKILGYGLLSGALALQGVFSGGLGILVNAVLMVFLGTTALEANVIKRYSQVLLNISIVLGVIGAHLIVWPYALVSVVTSFLGGLIGGRIAVKKGNRLIMTVMLILMTVSGLWLVFA